MAVEEEGKQRARSKLWGAAGCGSDRPSVLFGNLRGRSTSLTPHSTSLDL